ncbi:MAG: hypothetical protein ACI4KF_13220 [Huintestinicola sp.]
MRMKGSALIWCVLVLSVLTVIVLTSLGIAVSGYESVQDSGIDRQLYFSAKSAADAVRYQICGNNVYTAEEPPVMIGNALSGAGSTAGFDVDFENVADNDYEPDVTADFLMVDDSTALMTVTASLDGRCEKVCGYLKRIPAINNGSSNYAIVCRSMDNFTMAHSTVGTSLIFTPAEAMKTPVCMKLPDGGDSIYSDLVTGAVTDKDSCFFNVTAGGSYEFALGDNSYYIRYTSPDPSVFTFSGESIRQTANVFISMEASDVQELTLEAVPENVNIYVCSSDPLMPDTGAIGKGKVNIVNCNAIHGVIACDTMTIDRITAFDYVPADETFAFDTRVDMTKAYKWSFVRYTEGE